MDILGENENPQMQPVCGDISTEKLRAMEAADVAAEFEKVLDSMTDVDCDINAIDAYLKVLEEKAPAPSSKDPQIAYAEIRRRVENLSVNGDDVQRQTERNSPKRGKQSRYFGLKRVALVSAATVCLMFVLMIGAQAAGINVFGHLAQWTDEIFHFVIPSSEATHSEYYAPFQEALRVHGIPAELAPSWYPEGFQTDGPQYDEGNPFCDSVSVHFQNEDGRRFSVRVRQYFSVEDATFGSYEKDSHEVEQYVSSGRLFYIFSNVNTTTAVWANELQEVCIEGKLTVDEAKQIIDSVGG